ncbi:mitochondrial proton/calcium exchanger protein-like [Sycon ciliatum]|uniref:mitochondrial proton/calcium exchanger protein-like n=1 Tax=Sycon ciliatum TaxID=27933 RepID=UPI0020A86056|eukprot:scpid57738/ scgid34469/ LETM1 and EF-hand domain-containing protein 1, mitochondrial; Leucine zipper-EF-hand-containing transmembrane protein 1
MLSRSFRAVGCSMVPLRRCLYSYRNEAFRVQAAPLWRTQYRACHEKSQEQIDKEQIDKSKKVIGKSKEEIISKASEIRKEADSLIIKKPSLTTRFVKEVKHYYHGFRLLFIDARLAYGLLRKSSRGEGLTRRERKQLNRTTADVFRVIPFSVFIIVPFMEFLLPFVVYFFPNLLPSTFEDKDTKRKKLKTQLNVKLSMAGFLQDTLEEMADGAEGDKRNQIKEFSDFIRKVRTTGMPVSNADIIRYSKLFEDDLTLDSLTHKELQPLCRMLMLPAFGPDRILRMNLRMKLQSLEYDDKLIRKEGIDSLSIKELQQACQARGMRAIGLPEDRIKEQLEQWLEMHLDQQLPTSLLLLSRLFYLPENLPPEEVLKRTISKLPEATVEGVQIQNQEN